MAESAYCQSTMLQLCRPLSGAVRRRRRRRRRRFLCFNCAAPFRERLGPVLRGDFQAHARFNCAAPFRERLASSRTPLSRTGTGFNCAAPFRERLEGGIWPTNWPARGLQLCRPLSGAVRRPSAPLPPRRPSCFNCAAPFRERLVRRRSRGCEGVGASIVPPPFGSG